MMGITGALGIASILASVPTPLRLTADVEDAYALRYNPGGLGYINGFEARILYGRAPFDATNPGATGTTDGLGLLFGARLLPSLTIGGGFEADFESGETATRWMLGAAFRGDRVALGFVWEHLSPFNRAGKGLLTLGVTYRLARWVSAGLSVRDVGQNVDRRQWDIGLGFRPLGERLLLSTRWRLTQSQSLSKETLDLALLLSLEAIDGVLLGVGTNPRYRPKTAANESGVDLNLTVQLTLNFEQIGIGSSVHEENDGFHVASEIVIRSRPKPSFLTRSRVAVLELAGSLQPEPRFNLLSRSMEVAPYGAAPLLLQTLASSERVHGVLLRIAPLSVGWAKAVEVRRGIRAIRNQKKRVDCQLSGSDDMAYFVASACDSIIVAPSYNLGVNGLASNVLFLADGMDRLGVKAEVVKRGAYKSTPEQLTRSGMSVSQREALGLYLDRVFDTLVEAISDGRGLSKDQVLQVIEQGTATATEAVALELVDQVLFPDEVEEHLRKVYGHRLSFMDANRAPDPIRDRWSSPPAVAVIHVDAAITGGESRDMPFGMGRTSGAETIIAALEEARLDPRIRAVVLRVDSPGGDSYASDLMARAVGKLDEAKPVIASFGDIAASGGYYIASSARAIYAEPTTLTGSIGVFSLKLSVEGLLQKLGISTASLERGSVSNRSLYKDLNEEQLKVMSRQVDDAYRRFLTSVSQGRKMSVKDVRGVAEGRIWSGTDAKQKGLVDELGGFLEAIERAKAEGGLEEEVVLRTLPRNRSPLPEPLSTLSSALEPAPGEGTGFLGILGTDGVRLLRSVFTARIAGENRHPLALMPLVLNID